MMTSKFLVLAVFLTAGFLTQPVLAEGAAQMQKMIEKKSSQPASMAAAEAAAKANAAKAVIDKDPAAASPEIIKDATATLGKPPLDPAVVAISNNGIIEDAPAPVAPLQIPAQNGPAAENIRETMATKPELAPVAAAQQDALAMPAPMTAQMPRTASAPMQAQNAPRVDRSDIRLTPDSTKVIHLDQDAASVVVANPQQASVILDNPRLIVVMPKQPGTTSLTVLDANGNIISERRIIISGTQSKYVRVRRMCSKEDGNCVPSSYFYCPDGCYEVAPVPASDTLPNIPEIQGSPSADEALSPADQQAAPQNNAHAGAGNMNGATENVEPPRREPQ